MKIKSDYFLCFTILALFGCSGGSGSSPSTSTSEVRSQIFSDSAVTSFEQTGGVAINKPSLMDKVFASAYAVSGNISCVEDAPVSFELTALGNDVQVDTTCDAGIDLSIRQGLLESMAGKRILMYYGGGHDTRSEGRAIMFNAIGSFWGTYGNIPAGLSNQGNNEQHCKDKLTFNQTTGQVTIEHDVTASLIAGVDTTQDCLNSEFPGATLADYKHVLNFRFKDGKLEMHSNNAFPMDSDINQFCIDQDANGICD